MFFNLVRSAPLPIKVLINAFFSERLLILGITVAKLKNLVMQTRLIKQLDLVEEKKELLETLMQTRWAFSEGFAKFTLDNPFVKMNFQSYCEDCNVLYDTSFNRNIIKIDLMKSSLWIYRMMKNAKRFWKFTLKRQGRRQIPEQFVKKKNVKRRRHLLEKEWDKVSIISKKKTGQVIKKNKKNLRKLEF